MTVQDAIDRIYDVLGVTPAEMPYTDLEMGDTHREKMLFLLARCRSFNATMRMWNREFRGEFRTPYLRDIRAVRSIARDIERHLGIRRMSLRQARRIAGRDSE